MPDFYAPSDICLEVAPNASIKFFTELGFIKAWWQKTNKAFLGWKANWKWVCDLIVNCPTPPTVIVVLYVGLRRQKKKETLMSSKEDIRDNVIHYDDEGGGEEDTHAFDMGTLRNPKVVEEKLYRRDVKPEIRRGPRPPVSQDSADIRDFINQRLKEHDADHSAPPYDSLATYAYEGNGSVADSLSSIDSPAADLEENYHYLSEWGPRFKTLAGIFGEPETQSDSNSSNNTHWYFSQTQKANM